MSESTSPRRAGLTGAYGYVGSTIRRALAGVGWETHALVRRPRRDDPHAARYDLAARELPTQVLRSLELVVHCAWDFSATGRKAMWAVNVDGTRRLVEAVPRECRVIVMSSMSAYEGTRQCYGQAKLAVEAIALERSDGYVVRPGLVYGPGAGGMAGALTRLTRWPVIPVVSGAGRLYPVHEDDLAAAVVAVAGSDMPPAGPISVAQSGAVSLLTLLRALGGPGRTPPVIVVPWRGVYRALWLAEKLRAPVPFRSDSLLGLVRPAPLGPDPSVLADLGITPRLLDARGAATEPRAASM